MARPRPEAPEPARDTRAGPGAHPATLTGVSAEQRERMIAEAAYYLAEHRHFQGGDPLQDWLEAQAEIDTRINGTYRLKESDSSS
jgi:hypothetical protein